MPKIAIIIICSVVAVLVIALILVLLLRKKGGKNTEKDILLESKDIIGFNAQSVNALIVLAGSDPETEHALKMLQDKLRYLTPSTNEKVYAIDEKIKAELGDCKIELSKKRGESDADKLQTHLENIRLKIAERSMYTDRL